MRYIVSRALIIGCALGIVGAMTPTHTGASDYTKLTYFTFSGAVQVPGATLPAGTYQFKLGNPEWARNIVLVQDHRGRKTHAVCFTRPDGYREDAGDAEIMFHETREGVPPAVRGWFYPGEQTGYEFIYSGKQKRQIAANGGAAPARISAVSK